MLDAKIIQKSKFKKKVSLKEQKAQKRGPIPRGRQIAFMIYDYFRVTGAHETILDNVDLFFVTLHDDNIHEFDDILESLYKLRIRESDQIKNVSELYDMIIISRHRLLTIES